MNNDVNPNSPLVHQQRQEQKTIKQMDNMLKNKKSENGGNNSLISSHSNNEYDSGDEMAEKEFAELLKKYKISRCKEQFAKDGITSRDDLKYLCYRELDQIESKLPKLKRKQFIKLVRAVSEVCKNYKNATNNTSDMSRLSRMPNANNNNNNNYTNNNNNIQARYYQNGTVNNGGHQNSFGRNMYGNNMYQYGQLGNFNGTPNILPSINTSLVHTYDQKLLANMNGNNVYQSNVYGQLPSINTSPMQTYDNKLYGTPRLMNQYNT